MDGWTDVAGVDRGGNNTVMMSAIMDRYPDKYTQGMVWYSGT